MSLEPRPVRTEKILSAVGASGAIWSTSGEDLQVNLVAFEDGAGVDEHVNASVDVLYVFLAGTGTVTLDGVAVTVGPGDVMYVPRGASRSTHAESERLAYLTCHRRRAPLQVRPIRESRPAGSTGD
jgi:mannose-6-phosphate isomerase-like protein (cupin superfamily)